MAEKQLFFSIAGLNHPLYGARKGPNEETGEGDLLLLVRKNGQKKWRKDESNAGTVTHLRGYEEEEVG
uniref:Uncharacterized protein n=1 Tax=Onchocerca volvulus TaxID=6282 RepID=A0A8R1XYL7_ONCVO